MIRILLNRSAALCLALLMCCLSSNAARAQNIWEPLPSPIGFFQDRVQRDENGTLYVQSFDSLYLSTDNGDTWWSKPLPGHGFWEDATVIGKNTVIYNGTFRSNDTGVTYQALRKDSLHFEYICGTRLNGIAIARCDQKYHCITTDAGITWTRLSNLDSLPNSAAVEAIKIANNFTCLGSSTYWVPNCVAPSPFGPWRTSPYNLSLSDDGRLCRFDKSDNGFFLYISTNVGETWDSIDIPIPLSPVQLISNSKQYYIVTNESHLLRGDSSWQHWEDAGRISGTYGSIELLPDGTLFNTHDDLYFHSKHFPPSQPNMPIRRSTDGGHTWQDIGVTHQQITQLLVHDSSIYLKTQEGSLYVETSSSLSSPSYTTSLYNVRLLGFHHGVFTTVDLSNRQILTSSDQGKQWKVSAPFPYSYLPDQFGDPQPEIATVNNAFISEDVILLACEHGVQISTNGGNSWKAVADTSKRYQNIAETPDGKLWIGRDSLLFVSSDNGTSWSEVPIKLNCKAILMESPTSFVLLGEERSYRTSDNGNSWYPLALPSGVYCGIYVPAEGKFYISTYTGTYTSSDHGRTWISNHGNLGNKIVTAFELGSDGTLYAQTTDGLFKKSKAFEIVKSQPISSDYQAYPLPASSQFTIDPKTTIEITIYNSVGALAYQAHADRPLNIDVSCWPSGAYSIVSFGASGSCSTKMLIVQH